MNYKKLILSCVMPRLDIDKFAQDNDYSKYIMNLAKSGVSGFCLFGKVQIELVEKVIQILQNMADDNLIFSADFEHGLPMRFEDGTAFPQAMALGKTGDHQNTFIASQIIASESKEIGVDWIFGPVCDINSNTENPIINIRSFGEDAETVSNHASAYIQGLHEKGVISCAKHFPGHGDTNVDSHLSMPSIDKSFDQLLELELMPFQKAIRNEVNSMMIGHLALPQIDKEHPASISKKLINDILVNELYFDGIIMPDALEMKAITDNYSPETALELCFRSGNNLALIPTEIDKSILNLEQLVKKDAALLEHLEYSSSKIEELKNWSKSIPQEAFDEKREDRFLKHERISLGIAEKAVEIHAPKILTPLDEKEPVAGFAFLQSDHSFKQASLFFHLLQQATEVDIDFGFIDDSITTDDLKSLKSGISGAKKLIFANFYRAEAYNGGIGSAEKINNIQQYFTDDHPIIDIYFGNPYLEKKIKSDMWIKTFSDSLSSIATAVMILTGRRLDEGDQKGPQVQFPSR